MHLCNILSAGNSYAMSLWCSRLSRPFMLSLHAVWCIGAALSPVIVRPFLDIESSNSTHGETSTAIPYQDAYRVEYAYVTIGMIICGLGLLSLVVLALTSSVPQSPGKNTDKEQPEVTRNSNLGLSLALLPIFFIISTMEGSFVSFMAPLAVSHLGWTTQRSSFLVAALLVSFGISRLASIPLSAILRPSAMLWLNWIGMVSATVTLCFIQQHDLIAWVAVILGGASLATAFPNTILWAADFMKISGQATAVFVIGMQISSFVYPPLYGHLFGASLEGWIIYIMLGLAIFQVLYFSLLLMFLRRKHSDINNQLPNADRFEDTDIPDVDINEGNKYAAIPS